MNTTITTTTDTSSADTASTATPSRPRHRGRGRLAGLVAAAAACTALVATPTTVEARTVTSIDITVSETIPISTGTVVADTGLEDLGCQNAAVDTTDNSVRERGDRLIFTGTKSISCDAGDLTLRYRASVRGCATSDFGFWRVTGGTGAFSGARGAGFLVGTYTGGAGTNCDSTGIDDRYTGVVVLR